MQGMTDIGAVPDFRYSSQQKCVCLPAKITICRPTDLSERKRERAGSSETSMQTYHSMKYYILQDCCLHNHGRKNPKIHTRFLLVSLKCASHILMMFTINVLKSRQFRCKVRLHLEFNVKIFSVLMM